MGLKVALYPNPKEATIVLGYQLIVGNLASWFFTKKAFLSLLLLVIAGALVAFAQDIGDPSDNPQTLRQRFRSWLVSKPPFHQHLALFLVTTSVMIGALFFGLAFFFSVLVAPVTFGHTTGQNQAAMDWQRLRATPPTAEIRKDGEPLFIGHVLAVSENTISVYDPATQQVRTLPMDGLEIQQPKP